MKERWVILLIDEGYANFLLTENEEAFRQVENAISINGDEGGIDVLYNTSEEFSKHFENDANELEGVTVLGLIQVLAYW